MNDNKTLERVPRPSQPKRILIIDDDIDMQEAIGRALEEQGYHVVTTADGKLGLDYLLGGASPPGMILLDLSMPGMDGYEFCLEQRKIARISGIPVILVTAALDVAEKAATLKVAGYLRKPFNVHELLTVVQKHYASPS